MPMHLDGWSIGLRLALTLLASALLGADRSASGHAAGLRTTMLVGLAAAVAMIQANLLLGVDGKTSSSFSVLDLMRLPLGILTGVGFIGGGAIMRRGDMVRGVTTAATLWVTTVIGLCIGGGQLALGVGATALSVATLRALKPLDERINRSHRGSLTLECQAATSPAAVVAEIRALGYRARLKRQTAIGAGERQRMTLEVRWRNPRTGGPPQALLDEVGARWPLVSFSVEDEDWR